MGPVAQGKEITEDNLARLLGIIGIDCECGMDLSWTRGTRLPSRWSESTYRRVAESLGFDPENPMVRIEAGRILSRYGGVAAPTLGYREISLGEIEGEADSGLVSSDSVEVETNAAATPHPSITEPTPTDDASTATMVRRLLLIGGALGGSVLVIGAAILLRAWRQG